MEGHGQKTLGFQAAIFRADVPGENIARVVVDYGLHKGPGSILKAEDGDIQVPDFSGPKGPDAELWLWRINSDAALFET